MRPPCASPSSPPPSSFSSSTINLHCTTHTPPTNGTPQEVFFKNVHKLLLDTATTEYLFCMDFFDDASVFRDLFASVVSIAEASLHQAAADQWDVVGMLLMLRTNLEHRRIMMRRKVPGLDDYLDRVEMVWWPRLKIVFDAHLASLRAAGSEKVLLSGPAAAAAAHPDVHYVTRRYAALSSSMFHLLAGFDAEPQLSSASYANSVERLWGAMCDVLLRMSEMFKVCMSGTTLYSRQTLSTG